MPMPQLTTIDAMERYLSVHGIVSFSDHDADGISDDGVTDDAIKYGIGFTVGKLAYRYQIAYLANSSVAKEIATVVALYILCRRRANPDPDSIAAAYEEIVAKGGLLDQILAGTLQLLDDTTGVPIPGKAGSHPTHSNLTVDRRFYQETIRVQQGSSFPNTTRLERDNTIERPWNG